MTTLNEIYRCPVCGNIVEVLHPGAVLSCCGKPMVLLKGSENDGAKEKHVPVIRCETEEMRVSVGSVEHPMTEEHFIQWAEIVTDDEVYRHSFFPGDKPEVLFKIKGKPLYVRAYCNLHGLWKCKCPQEECEKA